MARAGLGPAWECLFANDIDPKKAEIYRRNWSPDVMNVDDVGNLTADDLPEIADLVWASFPCQDLSLAGNGAGLNGERSGSFWPFWRLVEQLIALDRKPKTLVIENVCGLMTSNGGEDFRNLCEVVGNSGYWIGAVVADARDFLPQSRPRLFLIAIDLRGALPGRIQRLSPDGHWHPSRLQKAYEELSTQAKSKWLWLCPPYPSPAKTALASLIEEHPDGVKWHTPSETAKLLDLMSPVNRRKVDLVVNNQGRSVGAVYRRTRIENGVRVQRAEVRFDVAGCLRTPGGGSSRQILLIAENGEVRSRLISARETARLMGLDDNYILPERYNDAYHLTGDGVAVPVVRHIVGNLIEPVLELSHEIGQVAG